AIVHRPVEALAALGQVDPEDLEGLLSAPILRLASSLGDMPPELIPELLRERLAEGERLLLERAARAAAPAAGATDCVHALRYARVKRESAEVQDEIDRLQQSGTTDDVLGGLLRRKAELARQLEALSQENA